jgi:hypothetical protein
MLDELEEGRLGPMDVVEDEHEPPFPCEHLAELPEQPGNLGRRGWRLSIEGSENRFALVTRWCLLENLPQGPVRDAVSVGEAASPQGHHALCPPRELRHEPRLADARWAHDDSRSRRTGFTGALERPSQRRELALPPYEWCVQPTLERR